MIIDFLRLGWSNITKRKLRSWLTMVGIFIGIAAVVSLISLGQGLQKYIDDEFAKLGRDKLMIQPKGTFAPGTTGPVTLDDSDVRAVQRVIGVSDAFGMMMRTGKIEFNDIIRYSYAVGVPTGDQKRLYDELFGSYEIEFGRDIKKGDKYKVVLGHYYYDRLLFEKNVKLGDKVLIKDQEFEVVGFYEIIGNPADDQNIYIPQKTMEELYDTKEDYALIVAKFEGIDPLLVADRVDKALRKARDLDEGDEDFVVQTTEEMMESFNQILIIVQIVLIGIAGISLFVGGVGIMNTMYTAVLERTKEIGIMKAIGARNSSIMLLFLIESGILGLIGGVIGVALGAGFSYLVEVIATAALQTVLLQAYFPWYLIVGSLAFSFIVGSVSGLLPAYNASQQNPADSLRYE